MVHLGLPHVNVMTKMDLCPVKVRDALSIMKLIASEMEINCYFEMRNIFLFAKLK